MEPQATYLELTTSKTIELTAVAILVLVPGWDEKMADCVVVSVLVFAYGRTTIPFALIFADSEEHSATPEKVIAARTCAQTVVLHGMAKIASRARWRHQVVRAGETKI